MRDWHTRGERRGPIRPPGTIRQTGGHVNEGGQAVIGNVGAPSARRNGAYSREAVTERSDEIVAK
jgi:hypothetical protein